MKCIGITGGIGCGKSTAGEILLHHISSVIDVDDISRRLTSTPGSPAVSMIEDSFGSSFLNEQGVVDRPKLASHIFSDPSSRKKLELILHPLIREAWVNEVEHWRKAGVNVGFVIVPLLFESELQSYFDEVVCVACSVDTQLERLRRRSWSDEESHRRISNQMPVSRKVALSDLVIWTDTTLELVELQITRYLLR